jgi:solute carrier family 36 (proton-coupled amino acid transporter)
MRVLRTLIVVLIALVAMSVPRFGDFVALIGSFCCSSLAFILPATCHLVLFNGNMSRLQKCTDVFMVCFGFIGMAFGVAEALRRITSADGGGID